MSVITNEQFNAAGIAIGIPDGKVTGITGGGGDKWPDTREGMTGLLQPRFAQHFLPQSAVEAFLDALQAGGGKVEGVKFEGDKKFASTEMVRRGVPGTVSSEDTLTADEETAADEKADAKAKAKAK